MTPERWRRVEELYHATLTRGESDRPAFLASACAGDETLRREVESLLAQPASARGFLDGPAVAVAAADGQRYRRLRPDRPAPGRLPGARAHRRGWHGRGLPRARHEAGPRRRDQDPAAPFHAAIPIGWRGSNARRACSRHSIIRTSARSTGWKTRTAFARWCSSWSRARRWPIASRAALSPFNDALTHCAPDRGRARCGAREGHRPPRSEAGQYQDHAGRRREGPRLRPGEGGRRRHGRPI